MYNLTFYKKALELHKHVGQAYKNWVIFLSQNQKKENIILYLMKIGLFFEDN